MLYADKIRVMLTEEIELGERIRTQPGDIKELAGSLEAIGQLQPVVLKGNQLIAGFRRVAAVMLLATEGRAVRGLEPGQVLAVDYFELSDYERLLAEFEENKQRKDFTKAEEALAIAKLKAQLESVKGKKVGSTELGRALNYSKGFITMALRVADAVNNEGKKELLKESSIPGAYRQLQSMEKLDELLKRSQKTSPKIRKEAAKTLHCGRAEDWIKTIPDESIDLINFDPPWGIGIDSYDRARKYGSFDDDADTGTQISIALIPELYRVLKQDTYMVVWFGIQYYQPLYERLEEAGFKVNPVPYIWFKTDKAGSQNDPTRTALNVWEPFFVCQKGNPRMFKHAQTNLLSYPMPRGIDRVHFAQKHEDLLKDIIERFSFGEMTILDPTFGSGAFFIAGRKLGRNIVGCEKDPENYEKALKWLGRSEQ